MYVVSPLQNANTWSIYTFPHGTELCCATQRSCSRVGQVAGLAGGSRREHVPAGARGIQGLVLPLQLTSLLDNFAFCCFLNILFPIQVLVHESELVRVGPFIQSLITILIVVIIPSPLRIPLDLGHNSPSSIRILPFAIFLEKDSSFHNPSLRKSRGPGCVAMTVRITPASDCNTKCSRSLPAGSFFPRFSSSSSPTNVCV